MLVKNKNTNYNKYKTLILSQYCIFFIQIFYSKEFTEIAKWVANSAIDPHIVEVIYSLLDEDGDRNLSVKEFTPVLFQWRRSRGFQHQNVQISMGQLQI